HSHREISDPAVAAGSGADQCLLLKWIPACPSALPLWARNKAAPARLRQQELQPLEAIPGLFSPSSLFPYYLLPVFLLPVSLLPASYHLPPTTYFLLPVLLLH